MFLETVKIHDTRLAKKPHKIRNSKLEEIVSATTFPCKNINVSKWNEPKSSVIMLSMTCIRKHAFYAWI